MTEPTPGPWRVEHFKVFGQPEKFYVKGDGAVVCWPETSADAHLIAAAKDMREALRLLVTWDNNHGGHAGDAEFGVYIEAARAALKQAGGGDE